MKIIVDNKIPFLKGVLEPFAAVEYYPGDKITTDRAKDADALVVRTRTKCNAGLLLGSKVKFIATATIGFDHIDTAYCEANNIKWANAPGCNSGSVMQYIASGLMHLSDQFNFSLSDKTIGIIGVGNVGIKIASLAENLGMKVLLNDPPRERKEGKAGFVSLEKIQENADIISFHVPLTFTGTDKTHHLFNHDFLKNIQDRAIILNSSRGEVVYGDALKKGLTSKKVNAAVIDVWENEPNIDMELLKLVDIGTPHIAGYSIDGKANGTAMSIQAMSRFFNFGLDNWFPESLPPAPNQKFSIDCKNHSTEEVIRQAILATYNIKRDDRNLRKSPVKFEEQRENYLMRREFQNFQPTLLNDSNDTKRLMNLLGFRDQ